jgi:hypothetical protein
MKLVTAVSAIALLGCRASQSQQVVGAPAAKDFIRGQIYYDCDAASGHTSQWSRMIEPAGSVTGSLFITEVRHDDDWVTFGGLMVSGPLPRNTVGINVTLDPAAMELRAQLRAPKATSDGAELGRAPTSGIQFALEWDAHKLRARIDPTDPWSEVALPFTPERLWLVCSTGNVIFHSISLTAPAPSDAPVPPASVEPPQ